MIPTIQNEDDLYAWLLILSVGHLSINYALHMLFYGWPDRESNRAIPRVFDASTFAASVLVLWGIMNPIVLQLIGNTKPFLAIGGLLGVVYGIAALRPRDI